MTVHLQDAAEARFLADVCEQYPAQGPNWQAQALFRCIHAAFTKSSAEKWGESILTHPRLVADLASCLITTLDRGPNDTLPWERWSLADYVLPRTLRSFMRTMCEAVQEGRVHEVNGKLLHGCYNVPRWYYEKCLEEERQKA